MTYRSLAFSRTEYRDQHPYKLNLLSLRIQLSKGLPMLLSSSSIFAENNDEPHSCSTISFQANRSLHASTSLPAITKANFLRLAPRKF